MIGAPGAARRTRALLAALLLSYLSPSPAVSASDAATDKALWCASAFTWLARAADDAADAEGAEIFDAWATRFTELGTAALKASGLGEASIEAEMSRYDDEVLGEMKVEAMRYDVESCPTLLPERQ